MSKYTVSFNELAGEVDEDEANEPAAKKIKPEKDKPIDPAVAAGIKSGHIKIAGAETMELSESAKEAKRRHDELLRQVEAKRRARTIIVPTNDLLVRKRLRELGHPITLFGERAPGRRDRLKSVLARLAVEQSNILETKAQREKEEEADGTKKKAYLVEGTQEMKEARLKIAKFSLQRANARVAEQHRIRNQPEPGEEEQIIADQHALERRLKRFHNVSSEIADRRPVAGCTFSPNSDMLATCSWHGTCKIFAVPDSNHLFTLKGQDNRVTDVVFHPSCGKGQARSAVNLASCDVDKNVHVWAMPAEGEVAPESEDEEMKEASDTPVRPPPKTNKRAPRLDPLQTLEGHTARCARVAFHPSGDYLASTSYDLTWRLWDLETSKCLFSQGGHSRPVYGLAMQTDGALCATGDIGGNARVWDLRTGKSILPLRAHSQQVLSMDFSPNGFHLATGADDHTIKIWDLRKRQTLYTIPAHTKLVSSVQYQPGKGDVLLSSSYDGTAKLWSGNDFSIIKVLVCHDKVMRAAMAPSSEYIATTSFDRTLRLWTEEAKET